MKIFSFFLSINDKKKNIYYTHTWASIVLFCGCESITAWSISSSETLLMRHHIKLIDLLVGADQFIVYMLQKHTRNTDTINYILHQITGAAICTRTRTRPACLVHPCLIQLLFVIFIMELVRYQGWSTNTLIGPPYTHITGHTLFTWAATWPNSSAPSSWPMLSCDWMFENDFKERWQNVSMQRRRPVPDQGQLDKNITWSLV